MTRWARLMIASTRLLAAAGLVAVLVAGFIAVRQLHREGEGLAVVPLVAAGACCLAIVAAQSLAWSSLLRNVSAGHTVRSAVVHRAFVVGWLARYLPGPSLSPVGKFLACRDGGVAPNRLGTAIVCEQLLQVTVLVAVPLLSAWTVVGPGRAAWFLAATALVAVVVVGGIRRMRGRMPGRVAAPLGIVPGRVVEIPLRALVGPFLLLLAASLASCAAFYIVAVAASPWPTSGVAEAIFIMGAAGLCGFIVPLVPSGAGVREAVIVALMTPEIGAGDSLAVAILVRAVAVAVDAGLALALGAFYSAGRLRRVQRYPMLRRPLKSRA